MSNAPRRRRQSPAVYRRRRLVLLLAFLLVAGGVALLIVQPWKASGSPAPQVSSTEQAPASEQPTTGDSTSTPQSDSVNPPSDGLTPVADGTCAAAQITITAQVDKQTYAAGENPQMSMVLTNNTETECSLDVGTATQIFQISSGDDVYWRSSDCQANPTNQVVKIPGGASLPSAQPITWDRTRSADDTCDSPDRPVAPADGASYHLTVSIGGIGSASSAQFILG